LSGHAPTAAVSVEVALLNRIVDGVRVECLGHDAAARRRHARKPGQGPASSSARAQHPEVLTEEDDRVEGSERRVDGIETEHTSISDTTPSATLDRAWRRVDADDLESPPLKMEAGPPTATTDVEDTPAHEPHRSPLVRVVPLRERREKVPRIEGHDESVVALDNLERGLPRERIG